MISKLRSLRTLIPYGSRPELVHQPFSLTRAMPKKKVEKKTIEEHGSEKILKGPILTNKDNTLSILVEARPGAKFNSVSEIREDSVVIQIAAPPVDGEANVELVKFMSKVLGLRKSDVSIDKGSRSRSKCLLVRGIDQDVALEALKKCEDS